MKTRTFFLSVLLSAFFLIPADVSAGHVVEDRFTETFSGISAGSVFKVFITQGEDFSVELHAPEEHLENIEVKVEDNILHISYTGRNRRLRDMEVHITAPVYTYLNASGASRIESKNNITASSLELIVSGASSMDLNLGVENLKTVISGASSITLRGEAQAHELISSGVSSVRAYDLATQTTDVKSSGTSSVRITVKNAIIAEASGTSSITVRGNPPNAQYSASSAASVRGIDAAAPRDTSVIDPVDDADTLVVRIGDREVVFPEGTRPEIRKRKTPRATWQNTWTGFYLGINGYVSPSGSFSLDDEASFMDLEYNNSVSVNLNLWQQNLAIIRGKNSNFGMFTGLGIGWNNYRFEQNIRLVHDDDQITHYTDTLHNFRKNKLTISHLNAPLMFEFQTHQNSRYSQFHMAAGVNAGLRLRSHTKYVYREDGSREKEKEFKSYDLAPFRYEAIVRIGWGRINLFATYALNSMFKDDKWPEIYPVNIGIRIINF